MMLVELAAECLEHGYKGRHDGHRDSSLVVAARVLVASHGWLECGKILQSRNSLVFAIELYILAIEGERGFVYRGNPDASPI